MRGGRKEAGVTAPNPTQKQKGIYLQMSWSLLSLEALSASKQLRYFAVSAGGLPSS